MKKIYSLMIVLLLVLAGCKDNKKPPITPEKPTFPTAEMMLEENQHDETIYVKLQKNGEVDRMKGVIHIADVLQDKFIKYQGHFLQEGHANLSNSLDLEVTSTSLKAPVLENNDHYFFEVALDKSHYELPYDFSFVYKLDGVITTYENILNKTGNVSIEIKVTPNYESPYMAQLQLPINIEHNQILSSQGASGQMLVGKTQTLVFMVMPNQNATFTIELDSKGFRLDGLQIALQTFDMLAVLPMDMASFGDIEQLPAGVGLVNQGVLELRNLDTLIQSLHPSLINGFDNVEAMSGFSQFDAMLSEETMATLIKPATYATTPETQPILPHVANIQSLLTQLQAANIKVTAFLTTHQPKLEAYKQSINAYTQAYGHVDNLIEKINEIEQTVSLIANASTDLKTLAKNKTQLIEALSQLDEQVTSFKASNLTLIQAFQLYEHVMTKHIITITDMLDITIELGTILTELTDEFSAYSASLKQVLAHVSDPEGIQAFQTAIAYLDGIEGSEENPGLIKVLTQALTQFDIPALIQNKAMLTLLLGENEQHIPILASPLAAFIALNNNLSLRGEQPKSFYEGLEQLINTRAYINLLPDDIAIKSFLNEENKKPASIQFVIIY